MARNEQHWVITIQYVAGDGPHTHTMSGTRRKVRGERRVDVYMSLFRQAVAAAGASEAVTLFWSLERNRARWWAL